MAELTPEQTSESNGNGGDQYNGLDRFGRIADQRWIKTSDGSATDRFKYGYDRDSNRLYRTDEVNHSFDELYHANGASNGYDGLNQLTDFRRGTLTDANSDRIPDTVTTASRTQSWAFDALGNFNSQTSDGTTQTRTHNQQNEITSVSSATTPTYNSNGNLTKDETGKQFAYDAFNRLVTVKDSSGNTLETLAYDGLGRRAPTQASPRPFRDPARPGHDTRFVAARFLGEPSDVSRRVGDQHPAAYAAGSPLRSPGDLRRSARRPLARRQRRAYTISVFTSLAVRASPRETTCDRIHSRPVHPLCRQANRREHVPRTDSGDIEPSA